MTAFSLALALGAAEGVFLAVLLFLKAGKDPLPNRALAGILALLSTAMLAHVVGHLTPLASDIHPVIITALFGCVAPLFYAYIRLSLPSPPLKRRTAIALWMAPLPILATGLLSRFFTDPLVGILQTTQDLGFVASAVLFSIAAIVRLIKAGKESNALFTRPLRLWLTAFTAALSSFWLLALLGEYAFNWENWDIVFSLCGLAILLVGNYGFLRPSVFWDRRGETERASAKVETAAGGALPKYRKSGLPDWMAERYRDKLVAYMTKEKAFTNPDLGLSNLAQSLGIAQHHLSRTINQELGASFYEYLAVLRVAEAKRLLEDPALRELGMADIGLRAGFNSISTFNTAFKRLCGKTPSEYRGEILRSPSAR